MRLLLTDRYCDRAKPQPNQTQSDYFDERVSGLALRVSGTFKSWTLHYRLSGKQVRWTLGSYPAISLASARTKALEAKAEIEAGRDPRSRQGDTFQSVAEDYIKREGPALRSIEARESALRRLVYPAIGAVPISDIRRSDIIRVLDAVEDNAGPVQADRTLAYMSRVFNWYAARSDDFRSPIVRGMRRTKAKERARDRILSDDELRKIWSHANGVFGAYIRFILLTAARRDEAARMEWSEIADGDWTLPAARNKTKVELIRPLSRAAQAILNEQPKGQWVFSLRGVAPIAGNLSVAKPLFDKACGVNGYTLHDCRRTSRSLMSRAGVDADIAERCLGHVIGGVRGVYDRHEYHREKARAYELLAGLIDRIVKGNAKVIALTPKAPTLSASP
jgi:integrase